MIVPSTFHVWHGVLPKRLFTKVRNPSSNSLWKEQQQQSRCIFGIASVSVYCGGYLPHQSGSVNIHCYSPPLGHIVQSQQHTVLQPPSNPIPFVEQDNNWYGALYVTFHLWKIWELILLVFFLFTGFWLSNHIFYCTHLYNYSTVCSTLQPYFGTKNNTHTLKSCQCIGPGCQQREAAVSGVILTWCGTWTHSTTQTEYFGHASSSSKHRDVRYCTVSGLYLKHHEQMMENVINKHWSLAENCTDAVRSEVINWAMPEIHK